MNKLNEDAAQSVPSALDRINPEKKAPGRLLKAKSEGDTPIATARWRASFLHGKNNHLQHSACARVHVVVWLRRACMQVCERALLCPGFKSPTWRACPTAPACLSASSPARLLTRSQGSLEPLPPPEPSCVVVELLQQYLCRCAHAPLHVRAAPLARLPFYKASKLAMAQPGGERS